MYAFVLQRQSSQGLMNLQAFLQNLVVLLNLAAQLRNLLQYILNFAIQLCILHSDSYLIGKYFQ